MDNLEQLESSWKGHRAFAEWLTQRLQPKITVELGVDYGYSLFCLANKNSGRVIGIDLFEGDAHAGEREKTQHETVQQFATDNQYTNVQLIKGDFNQLVKYWVAPIDILHIDGLHTYEACLMDFVNWGPHVSPNGVVLMHDITSYPDVTRVFLEVGAQAKVAFLHSAGLGVICRDPALAQEILAQYPDAVTGQALADEMNKLAERAKLYQANFSQTV
jgi:predicted O-methyltransferase YrrM